MITQYLNPFFISFALSVATMILLVQLFKKKIWNNRNSSRHIHQIGVSRFGGIALVLVFNLVILLNKNLVLTTELVGFMLGTVALLIVGIWDDLKELFWKTQLFFQIALAVFVFIMGVRIYYITNPLTGGIINLDTGFYVLIAVALVVSWLVLSMNAINWADGIDGLASGITLITLGTIFFLSLKPEVNQPPVAIISVILIGTILGFFIFNFYPSKILAGTPGAMFMGFSLAVLAIFAGTKIATALLVLVIPMVDFIWVIGERIESHKSIFKPDKNHLHYKLMELGWSQKKIVNSYLVVTSIIAVIALNTRAIGKGITLILAVLAVIISLVLIRKKINYLKKCRS